MPSPTTSTSSTNTVVSVLRGRDLHGAGRRIPSDLPADPTLVVFGFRAPQQRDIDAWLAVAAGRPFVEAVLIPRRQEIARGRIEGGMAAFLTDPAVRARTWCLYADVDATLTALGTSGQDEVVAAVIRRSGRVDALVRGAPTPRTLAVIDAAMPPLPAAARR